jgi:O-succinylbenzoic acid--CoA ligase
LPPQHVAGLQVLVRSALAGTSPVLLDDHADLPTATAALSASARFVSVVPTQLHRWLAEPVGSRALASYDAVLVGGATADKRLLQRAQDAGVSVVATYGMTETCGGCVYDGVPLDGVGIAIGASGRIRINGPVLFDGYADREEPSAAVLQDGWFVTADVGRLDVDGRLEVLGRVDDVIVSGGVNVPLEPVRRRLLARQELVEVAVLGVPDPEWGHRVVAVATLADGATAPDLGELRDFVAAEHPREWAPRELVVRERLPMLESGKVDRLSLVAELAGGS